MPITRLMAPPAIQDTTASIITIRALLEPTKILQLAAALVLVAQLMTAKEAAVTGIDQKGHVNLDPPPQEASDKITPLLLVATQAMALLVPLGQPSTQTPPLAEQELLAIHQAFLNKLDPRVENDGTSKRDNTSYRLWYFDDWNYRHYRH